MRIHRRKSETLSEPPAVLLVDIAFNLLIFFVVCASTEPQEGRKQGIPGSQPNQTDAAQASNIEVALTRSTAAINGDLVKPAEFSARLKNMLLGKTRPEDRVVVVKSSRDTTYAQWIRYTGLIEEAGGVTTLQIEEQAASEAP